MTVAKKTTAKKAVPSLSDLRGNSTSDEEPVVTTPDEPVVTDEKVDGVVEEFDRDEDYTEEVTDSFLIPSDSNPVHTWEEDHDQNLARVQKDVIESAPPSEHATVVTTTSETVYADEAVQDDKGRKVDTSDEEESKVND